MKYTVYLKNTNRNKEEVYEKNEKTFRIYYGNCHDFHNLSTGDNICSSEKNLYYFRKNACPDRKKRSAKT